MGFALLWLALAAAMVVRARRRGMGFAMTWWAFTFPVGTCVTGAEGLARHTGLVAFDGLAVALYVLLVGRLVGGRRPYGPRPGQRRAARSASPSTRGACASDGPYQVSMASVDERAGQALERLGSVVRA